MDDRRLNSCSIARCREVYCPATLWLILMPDRIGSAFDGVHEIGAMVDSAFRFELPFFRYLVTQV